MIGAMRLVPRRQLSLEESCSGAVGTVRARRPSPAAERALLPEGPLPLVAGRGHIPFRGGGSRQRGFPSESDVVDVDWRRDPAENGEVVQGTAVKESHSSGELLVYGFLLTIGRLLGRTTPSRTIHR